MKRILTHFNVDLDAASSVWAVQRFVEGYGLAPLKFVTANYSEKLENGEIAVDITADGQGVKGEVTEGGNVLSAFSSLLDLYAPDDVQEAMQDYCIFLNAQEGFGSAAKHLAPNSAQSSILERTGMNACFRALQATTSTDVETCELWGRVLDGFLKAGMARQRAEKEADRATILDSGLVAISRDPKEFATNGVLFSRGIKAVVFVQGNNLGVVREGAVMQRMDDDRIKAVVEDKGELDEWFAHPAGFLFCRGSRKAPAKNLSKVDPLELAKAVEGVLKSGNRQR